MATVRRRLLERKLKETLLEIAQKENIDPCELAEWIYFASGVRVRKPIWDEIRKAILSSNITAQELAAHLITEYGIEVNEDLWLKILKDETFTTSQTKILGGRERR